MRKKYLFSSRRTRHTENISKQRSKYPEITKEIVEMSDIILEVLDARFIEKTRNIELEKEIERKNKIIIYVLNKSDLVKSSKLSEIKGTLFPYAVVSCTKRKGIKNLRDLIKKLSKKVAKKEPKVTVGVIGYPNTGKSSLINILSGKSGAGVGSDAGFTKNMQKIRLSSDIVLIDSPGVIPEEKYSQTDTKKISTMTLLGGKSYSQIKEPELIINELFKENKNALEKHYKISSKDAEELIEKIGRKKNFLKKGGSVNTDKTAREVLRAWQKGEIKI